MLMTREHARIVALHAHSNKAGNEVDNTPFRLTFGSTYHGVQCRSMDKIILVVDDSCLPALTYNAFYVGTSRVRQLKVFVSFARGSVKNQWKIGGPQLKSLIPKVMVARHLLKVGYEEAHTLLNNMYADLGLTTIKEARTKEYMASHPRKPLRRDLFLASNNAVGCTGHGGQEYHPTTALENRAPKTLWTLFCGSEHPRNHGYVTTPSFPFI